MCVCVCVCVCVCRYVHDFKSYAWAKTKLMLGKDLKFSTQAYSKAQSTLNLAKDDHSAEPVCNDWGGLLLSQMPDFKQSQGAQRNRKIWSIQIRK